MEVEKYVFDRFIAGSSKLNFSNQSDSILCPKLANIMGK
jgi:hypothetical protein